MFILIEPGSLTEGVNKASDTAILVHDEDLVDLASGRLSLQSLLQGRRINVKGKVEAMTQFTSALLGIKPKL